MKREILALGKTLAMFAVVMVLLSPFAASASYDFEGSGDNDYATSSSTPITAVPLTAAGWMKWEGNDGGSQALFTIADTSTINEYFACYRAEGTSPDDPLQVHTRSSAASVNTVTTTGSTIDIWHHVACVWASASSRDVYIDGGSEANNSSSSTPSGLDTIRLGMLADSTPEFDFNGKLAHWALWSAALSSGEIAALAAGACPNTIDNANLEAYWPMTDDTGGGTTIDDEDTGTYNLTISGTVTFDATDNPPVSCKARPVRRH